MYGLHHRYVESRCQQSMGYFPRSGDVIHPQLWESGSGYEIRRLFDGTECTLGPGQFEAFDMKKLHFMQQYCLIPVPAQMAQVKSVMVTVNENRRIIYMTEEQNLEQSIRETFSDIIEAGENILIQVEQNWGGRIFYVDLQNRQIVDKSVFQVLRLQQVG